MADINIDTTIKNKNQRNLEYFETRNNIDLPYAFEVNSGKPGKHIVIVGGIHGHESAGVEAIKYINNHIESSTFKLEFGKVTFILGNPHAHKINQRLVDKNLNRAFLQDLEEGVESDRASEIKKYLENNKIEFLLDLHTVSQGDLKLIAVYSEDNKMLATRMTSFNIIAQLSEDNTPGSLALQCEKLGIPAFMMECGNNTSRASVLIARSNIVLALRYFGLIEEIEEYHDLTKFKPQNNPKVYILLEAIKTDYDFRFADPSAVTGTQLKAGQEYAFGANNNYFAQQDCVIFIPDHNPSPKDHDAGFLAKLESASG